jgi:thioester reductase-like protein
VTNIIHNAWQLDFNLALSSFEPHIIGTRNLVDFALASPLSNYLRFMFTSSIGTGQSWLKDMGPYPEEIQMDARYAVGGGYGESKYICERVGHFNYCICTFVAQHRYQHLQILANSGLQATSFRIGQITGPVLNGAWAMTDWVPILVKSSIAIGSLPDSAGKISWLPVTAVSDCIIEVMFRQDQPPLALNVVHPKPVAWTKMITDIREALLYAGCIGETEMTIIPFSEWFSKLETAARQADANTMRDIVSVFSSL